MQTVVRRERAAVFFCDTRYYKFAVITVSNGIRNV